MPYKQVLFRSEALEKVLRQAAEKTGDIVGDGTSTATILARAMFADGVRNVVAGASSNETSKNYSRSTSARFDAGQTPGRR